MNKQRPQGDTTSNNKQKRKNKMNNNNNNTDNNNTDETQGVRGRPRNITDAQLRYCVKMYENGRTVQEVTRSLNSKYRKNYSPQTLGYHLRNLGITRPRGRRPSANNS